MLRSKHARVFSSATSSDISGPRQIYEKRLPIEGRPIPKSKRKIFAVRSSMISLRVDHFPYKVSASLYLCNKNIDLQQPTV